jgi:hypothetical protein
LKPFTIVLTLSNLLSSQPLTNLRSSSFMSSRFFVTEEMTRNVVRSNRTSSSDDVSERYVER